jgi:beta-aspartyl-dipeptidase (metallo-type)
MRQTLTLIRNADAYAPGHLGLRDILMGAGSILAVEAPGNLRSYENAPGVRLIDADGLTAVPGFIDNHLHLIGGGGEGGYTTRTPEMMLGELVSHGVTSVVGTRGTDGTSRSAADLLAKVKALREEGISAWCWIGNYHLPVGTITGNPTDDIMLIEEIIGVGEVAISDHRSSQPDMRELARLASRARIGGMLSGKAGLVNIHLGDGDGRLDLLQRIVHETDIPIAQFLPTHLTRNPKLFEEATEWARKGGNVDFTAGTIQAFLDEGEIRASEGLRRMLESGVALDRICFSSDAGGSLPSFDANGTLTGMSIGSCSSLLEELNRSVSDQGLDLSTALAPLTENPARMLKLAGKGRLEAGADADLLLLSRQSRPSGIPGNAGWYTIERVYARGQAMVADGKLLRRSRFESQAVQGGMHQTEFQEESQDETAKE